MINKIFIENSVKENIQTKRIVNHFKNNSIEYINDLNDYFGKVKKPYLHKRDSLNLFVGKKKGQLIKETPDAYGMDNGKHFYFIHAYNCIYECQYCYLQGYFNSPDIVLFVNHSEIINEMARISKAHKKVWFHAGEFSDSLALSNITQEWSEYWSFFKANPHCFLELRSKSANIKSIIDLEPLPNTIISFSLASKEEVEQFDFKTPKLKARLRAIKELTSKGFQIGIHLDPVIYTPNFETKYTQLFNELQLVLPVKNLAYISLGVVRFTKESYEDLKKNYPESQIHNQPLIKSFDGKVRYRRPLRRKILKTLNDIFKKYYTQEKIYYCMENLD
jgi:spore photoproduct lyase